MEHRPFIPELINLFCRFNLNEIDLDLKYQKLCNQYLNNQSFCLILPKLKKHKAYIENIESEYQINNEKVTCALTYIRKLKISLTNFRSLKLSKDDESSIRIAIQLIETFYSNTWNKLQIEYFIIKSEIILNSTSDYFLSFTTRKTNSIIYNPINIKYKHFIFNTLGPMPKHEMKNKNLVAEAIACILADHLRIGFYYPDREEDNTNVSEKVYDACKSSLIFIQIIQNIIFKLLPYNYCFNEYNHFLNTCLKQERNDRISSYKRIKFILAEDSHKLLIKNRDISQEYNSWHEHVSQIDKISLGIGPKTDADGKSLKNKIELALHETFERFLDDFLMNDVPRD
jgi:hypothetical protein